MVPEAHKNSVKALPYTEGALDTFAKYGYMMFPQQRSIYEGTAKRIPTMSTILEVGCGIGLGTAILDRSLTTKVIGTDNLPENIKIAKALYPWIKFDIWDITKHSFSQKADILVAVEVIEHVSDPLIALQMMCNYAMREVWFSTPNGKGKKRPPENPYHVCEYTAWEILKMVGTIPGKWGVEIFSSELTQVSLDSDANPLVYHLTRERK